MSDERTRAEADLDEAWERFERDDVKGAARALERARRALPDEPDALALAVELALARDDTDEALKVLQRWTALAPDDPTPPRTTAEVLFYEMGEEKLAVSMLRRCLDTMELSAEEEAETRHLLGELLEESGDEDGAGQQFFAVRTLDARTMRGPQPRMSREEFERVAEAALAELPGELRERLRDVAIVVDDQPSKEMVRDGIDPRILGLYHGVPLDRQSVFGAPHPQVIYLFQRNIERVTRDREDLARQIRITVAHETAHYFGLGEEDLDRLGLR